MTTGHQHGIASKSRDSDGRNPDTKYLGAALGLILVFMAGEVVVGLLASSLALLTDAGHMLTDAAAIAFALVAARLAARPARGNLTYGLRRVEILSAQANGLTLWALAVWFTYQGIARLVDPPAVEGLPVLITALAGVAVNLGATWLMSRANRTSLNVEGAFQHILNDLFAFIAIAIAGLVVVLTGWVRADAVAALVVAALMVKGGWGLIRDSWRIFLEAAPRGIDVAAIDADLHAVEGVVEIHDLHVWEVTSGFPPCLPTSSSSPSVTATNAGRSSPTSFRPPTTSTTSPSRSTTSRPCRSSPPPTSSTPQSRSPDEHRHQSDQEKQRYRPSQCRCRHRRRDPAVATANAPATSHATSVCGPAPPSGSTAPTSFSSSPWLSWPDAPACGCRSRRWWGACSAGA